MLRLRQSSATGLDYMADGPGKAEANAEVAAVNTAMSNGDMRGCAIHLRKATQLEMSKPSSMSNGM